MTFTSVLFLTRALKQFAHNMEVAKKTITDQTDHSTGQTNNGVDEIHWSDLAPIENLCQLLNRNFRRKNIASYRSCISPIKPLMELLVRGMNWQLSTIEFQLMLTFYLLVCSKLLSNQIYSFPFIDLVKLDGGGGGGDFSPLLYHSDVIISICSSR